jgi:hypothetical protein
MSEDFAFWRVYSCVDLATYFPFGGNTFSPFRLKLNIFQPVAEADLFPPGRFPTATGLKSPKATGKAALALRAKGIYPYGALAPKLVFG